MANEADARERPIGLRLGRHGHLTSIRIQATSAPSTLDVHGPEPAQRHDRVGRAPIEHPP